MKIIKRCTFLVLSICVFSLVGCNNNSGKVTDTYYYYFDDNDSTILHLCNSPIGGKTKEVKTISLDTKGEKVYYGVDKQDVTDEWSSYLMNIKYPEDEDKFDKRLGVGQYSKLYQDVWGDPNDSIFAN